MSSYRSDACRNEGGVSLMVLCVTTSPPSTAKSVSVGGEDPTLQLDCKGDSVDAAAPPQGSIVGGPRCFKPRQSSVRSSGTCSAGPCSPPAAKLRRSAEASSQTLRGVVRSLNHPDGGQTRFAVDDPHA